MLTSLKLAKQGQLIAIDESLGGLKPDLGEKAAIN
jgi:hypothetical protein